jgi:hypothetical protein
MGQNKTIRIIGMALVSVLCFVLSAFCAVAQNAESSDAPNVIQSFPVAPNPWGSYLRWGQYLDNKPRQHERQQVASKRWRLAWHI